MARLPKPGGDRDSWGSILNEFLNQEHNSDGTLKKAGDIASAKADSAQAKTDIKDHKALTTTAHGGIVASSDPRLTNARAPDTHASTHANGGSDEVALDASQVTSGVFDEARIPASIARDSEVTGAQSYVASLASALYLNGTVLNGVSTPNLAAYTPATSLSVRVAAALDDWTPVPVPVFIAHFGNSGSYSWELLANSVGSLGFFLSNNGTSVAVINSTANHGFVDGSLGLFRADWTSAGEVKFYTKPVGILSVVDNLTSDSGWVQLGATVTTGVPTSLFASTSDLWCGAVSTGTFPVVGKFVAARVLVDGIVQAAPDFRRSFADRYRDPVSRIWTRQGSAHSWTDAPIGVSVIQP